MYCGFEVMFYFLNFVRVSQGLDYKWLSPKARCACFSCMSSNAIAQIPFESHLCLKIFELSKWFNFYIAVVSEIWVFRKDIFFCSIDFEAFLWNTKRRD
jgi:hypothetical protein